MALSEKTRERLDGAGRDIKEAVDNLRHEVEDLSKKIRERFKGAGDDVRESAEALSREVKGLSERVRELVPKRRKGRQLPARMDRPFGFQPDSGEHPFLELRRATDQLFDDFFRNFGWPLAEGRSPWDVTADVWGMNDWPRVDMSENDEEIEVVAELPGVKKDDIDISVSNDRITIRGEKEEKEERRKRGYYRFERSTGSFQRSFFLPAEVESDKVDATFKDGVLTVKLPKSAAARERIKKIPVRAG